MNIQNYMPELKGRAPALSVAAIEEILANRSKVFRGFAHTEARNGLLVLDRPLCDSKAQDSLRLLVYRYIEELFESADAQDHAHVLEEGIDALNYLISFALIEAPYLTRDTSGPLNTRLTYRLHECFVSWVSLLESEDTEVSIGFNISEIMEAITPIFSNLSPKLRNRAWMNETQQTDFAYDELLNVIEYGTMLILSLFESWDEFWEYFMAKNAVLLFRLESKY